jgi:hypothetical protein
MRKPKASAEVGTKAKAQSRYRGPVTDHEIAEMVRDLIEYGTLWDEETRKAALAWLKKVVISNEAVRQLLKEDK